MSIRWTKTVEIEQEVKLVVDTNPDVEPDDLDELLGALRDATIDDLRAACEAAKLVVLTQKQVAVNNDQVRQLTCDFDAEKVRAEKAEAELAHIKSVVVQNLENGQQAWKTKFEMAEAALQGAVEEAGALRSERDALRAPVAGEPSQHSIGASGSCLITHLVNAGDVDEVRLQRGEVDGKWTVSVALVDSPSKVRDVPAKDVRATIARLALVIAPAQPTDERATDEELACLAFTVDNPAAPGSTWTEGSNALHKRYAAIARAVAARVRAERCLVTRAVASGKPVTIRPSAEDSQKHLVVVGASLASCAPADVPATLARMLGGGQ